MPAPYSYDLRSKAVAEKKVEVSHFFKISRNTLDLWLKKERETPDVKASLPVGVGTRPKIQDLKKFEEFVRENRDQTKKEMAQLWGDEDPQQNISYGKKVGITRKKNLWLSRKR
jgi:transposase